MQCEMEMGGRGVGVALADWSGLTQTDRKLGRLVFAAKIKGDTVM